MQSAAGEVMVSPDFKRQATKAALSITLFLFTYLALFLVALGLTMVCVYAGVALIVARPMMITIGLGLGLASLGILILIFLVKFVSQSRKVDRSHMLEVTREDEPGLFTLLDDVAARVGTRSPKRVYLSSEVNAAVFYDSSFWSMIFPVRKNLLIGVGLVNTLTRTELMAVLAHEFGHFSQRSMKVGSYVYHVNQVIFNLLFENDGYNDLVQRWANLSGYFSIFVALAVKAVAGIQVLLRSLYTVVNRNYLALSREMEFHADAIAASVTGPRPLINALFRMNLANTALEKVVAYQTTHAGQRLQNIFQEQRFVLEFLARENDIPLVASLPQVDAQRYNAFNKSRLHLNDQWASHPTIVERADRLNARPTNDTAEDQKPAGAIFRNFDHTQRALTNHFLNVAELAREGSPGSTDEFRKEFESSYRQTSFPRIFNGYYEARNPGKFVLHADHGPFDGSIAALFSNEMVEKAHVAQALQYDAFLIRQITLGQLPVDTFDYDGIKYKATDAPPLLSRLENELATANQELDENDKMIYRYFRSLEKAQGHSRLASLYSEFAGAEQQVQEELALTGQLQEMLQFVQTTTPVEVIKENFQQIRPLEEQLKTSIRKVLEDPQRAKELPAEARSKFERFVANDLEYFGVTTYMDQNLELLVYAINEYANVVSARVFNLKLSLLNYQEELWKNSKSAVG